MNRGHFFFFSFFFFHVATWSRRTVWKSFLPPRGRAQRRRRRRKDRVRRWRKGRARNRWRRGKKNRDHICKLILTAQQGAHVDRGEGWSDLLTGRTQARRHMRPNKFNHLLHQLETTSAFPSSKAATASSSSSPAPLLGLNQLQTNLILCGGTGGNKQ